MRKDRENNRYKEVNAKVLSNIKFRRKVLGFKQSEIAKVLDISQENYSEHERGYRVIPPALLYNIAHALAFTTNDLFDGCSVNIKKLKAKETIKDDFTYKAKEIANMYDSLPEGMQVHYFELLKNMTENTRGTKHEQEEAVLFTES